ncbi:MAG: hypothetical protein ACKVWV_12225 [Planctomycetota bacterium]
MSHQMLDAYARLLTIDTKACAELFDADAQYSTHIGSQELVFVGRDDIEGFLRHVPRQLTFRAAACRRDGDSFRGEVTVIGDGFTPRAHFVCYYVADGLFTRFDVQHP